MSKTTKAARRSSAEWLALVERCVQSGLSCSAFAEREGIHPRTFTWWASRLGAGGRRRSLEPKARTTSAASTTTFVPVRVRSSAPPPARVAAGLVRTSDARPGDPAGGEGERANGGRVRGDLEQVSEPRLAALLALAEGSGVC